MTKEMRQEVAVAGLREAAREALEYWEMKNRDASSEAGLERAMFELDHWESQLRKLDKDR
ncbi:MULTISPECIES: hypothetical protein [Xanthomonas]|uniref:hypothetical protein n=1 Tax=Xanthomonas TaxID=338 RepID=UPI001D0CB320|nr:MULTISPECIES: hypothetical protein [Xanthomonas]UZA99182.1 hypothetical protein OM946_19020 [Xanthomonas citri pv. fuscans]UZB04353.1 hypothetical protein OM948_02070 [Xanthomonas citri pv. fuscans]